MKRILMHLRAAFFFFLSGEVWNEIRQAFGSQRNTAAARLCDANDLKARFESILGGLFTIVTILQARGVRLAEEHLDGHRGSRTFVLRSRITSLEYSHTNCAHKLLKEKQTRPCCINHERRVTVFWK